MLEDRRGAREQCGAAGADGEGSSRFLLAGCSLGGQVERGGITCAEHPLFPNPPSMQESECLALKAKAARCAGGLVGVPAPPALSSWTWARWRQVDNTKKKGSKIPIILENEEKPVSRKAEVDLPCILTIYGVLMGLFKSCFPLLFNKKHIYHSNHLGREEHILPLRWRPPSKRATAGICNVIFCATYNVGGRGEGGSEGGVVGFLGGGGFCKVSCLFLAVNCFVLFC